MKTAIELLPDDAEAHINLGVALQDLRQFNDAAANCRWALTIRPDHAIAHNNLGNVLKDLGQPDAALASFRRALEIKPDLAEGYNNRGTVLQTLGRLDDAVASYCRALELKSDFTKASNNLGIVLTDLGQFYDAVASYRRAIELSPEYADAHNNLGNAQQALGQLRDAVGSYRRALEIKPDFPDAHSNLLFALDMTPGVDLATLQQERSRWDFRHAAPLAALQRPHANRPDPRRRLRIGYVSADFRAQSAAYVFGAMLVQFDSSAFDVFAYSNSGKEDTLTALFRQGATRWRNIIGLADEAVAEVIRQDEIDILVDLSGHMAGNRLLVFARKPAPIQITAWGNATSTGMRAMDVLLADPVVVPPDDRRFFTEEVRYLPSLVGSFFPQEFAPVNALPAWSDRDITFGSLNRLAKVSEGTFHAWGQILLTLPNSRLLLKTRELNDRVAKENLVNRFRDVRVDPERIVLLGRTSRQAHVATFNQVDIALDPFPQGGGVTTLEGLMMGVPLIALRGRTIPGRGSASILTTLGLTDWIAETPDQYVELALQKARDLPALASLRSQLRGIFTSSIIGDSQAYVRAVEQQYRQLWLEWCAKSERPHRSENGTRAMNSS